MYDPEYSLLSEETLNQFRASADRLRELLPGNPVAEEFDKVVELQEEIIAVKNDFDNCFDEDRKDQLRGELRDLLCLQLQTLNDAVKPFLPPLQTLNDAVKPFLPPSSNGLG